ncbi:MFS transporter [Flagellimonas pacifica]|uniref:Predicted arabinose efflux permease, MFS family n=1 Tax=Flagellimonas pacifica TaxID=1247520 RepID=A0A285MS21_9FLAO|nr:MFS transporter [Allomuricauda parva]SNY99984.1 Predicted arabinose efflux permease, MFS family [Allomuricauda parva]
MAITKGKIQSTRASNRMYTPKFILICLSSLFFSASYNMLIPELPAYLSSLGGAQYIGLIIALFTLTAGISRPFSGKLTDTIGRKPVMVIGAMVCLVCGCFYPILTTVYGFLLLRLLHGFSTGFTPTATSTFVSDVVPQKRLGEAMGIQGMAFSIGLALGPALGSLIKLHFSYSTLFYSSSVMAFLALLLIVNLKETLPKKQSFKWNLLRISRKEIIAIEALPAAVVTFLFYLSLGVILTLIPDWTEAVGFANKGIFFVVFTVSSLVVRFIAGKFSDHYGRTKVIVVGLFLLFAAMLCIGYFSTKLGLLLGSIVYGLSMGIVSPAVNAWVIDLSKPEQKGRAIATMYIALEAGIGLGALLSGWYYQETISKIPIIMYYCAIFAILGIGYIFLLERNYWTNN